MRWAALVFLFGFGAMVRGGPPSPNPEFRVGERIAADDFHAGLHRWRAELETGGRVVAAAGVLELDVPGGCTLWFRQPFSGAVLISYEARAVSRGGTNDRVSDLNCFWMARDARSPADLFATTRSGRFADYDPLRCYYVGLGGNGNTTTRFRRYVGEPGHRPLRPEHDLSAPGDLLQPNAWQKIDLIAASEVVEFYRDGRRLLGHHDAAPYTSGWFGLRTVASHLEVRNFRVHRLERAAATAR